MKHTKNSKQKAKGSNRGGKYSSSNERFSIDEKGNQKDILDQHYLCKSIEKSQYDDNDSFNPELKDESFDDDNYESHSKRNKQKEIKIKHKNTIKSGNNDNNNNHNELEYLNNDDDDSSNYPKEEKSSFRKLPIRLDYQYQIPLCYVDIYEKSLHENKELFKKEEKKKQIQKEIQKENVKLSIKVIKNRTRKETNLSWKENPFTKKEMEELCKTIKDKFKTQCHVNDKNKCLSFSGRKPRQLKDYLVDYFHFLPNNISITDIERKIPDKFKIEISLDENQEDLIEIMFLYKNWNDDMFFEFVDEFKTDLSKDYDIELVDEIDHNMKYSLIFKGDNLMDIATNYLVDKCGIKREQIKADRKLVLSRKYSKINTYKEMKERFQNFDLSSYFREMSDTIRDAYKIEKYLLSKFIIHTNLTFNFIFTDDDRFNYYMIKIDIKNAFNIDGIKAGQGISEGHEVIVTHKRSKLYIVGYITKMKNGNATIIFRLKPNHVPPGCSKNDNYIEANFDQYDEYKKRYQYEDDDDGMIDEDDDYIKDDDFNNKKGDYIITFRPNDAVFKRSSMSLLVLNDIKSGIKDIITCDPKLYNEKMNHICNDKIDDEGTIQLGAFQIKPTPSQRECINNILQNQVSLIQGPPGCGKTTSIGFFVYHLLKKNQNERKRILLCAYSNQAVENMVKVVFPIVKALGKKMVWIPNQAMHFETEEEFTYASEEEKNLSYYKILTGDKIGCDQFRNLQEKKWKFSEEMERYEEALMKNNAKDFMWDSDVQAFSEYDNNQMYHLQIQIEEKLVSESDVVCCTLLQSAKKSVVDFKFEYLFVDEATQVDQINSLIPLIHQPSRMVLMGDHKQLDPFISEQMKRKHPFSTQSLYLYLISKKVKSVMLKTQFRMHPLISMFPNREFYDNQIINADGMEEKTKVDLVGIVTPILFVDTCGNEQKVFGSSFSNSKEADVVVNLLYNFKMNNVPSSEVGVITPYFGQKELIKSKSQSLNYSGVRISSVDSFQGSERDFIILSLVRANGEGKFGFLANQNRINVSITRARKGLIIVGNFNSIINSNQNNQNPQNQFLVNLCQFYQEQKAVVSDSTIKRILPVKIKLPEIKIDYKKKVDEEEDFDDDFND